MRPLGMRARVLRRLKALLSDQRGAYDLIQLTLIIPIFGILLYGSFEVLKLLSIRQSLDAGTYQASRYLSVYHKFYYDDKYNRTSANDQLQAERLIWETLIANPFISQDAPPNVVIRYLDHEGREIPPPTDFPCPDIKILSDSSQLAFTVRTQMTLPWKTSVLGVPMGDITMVSAHTAVVDCGPWYPPPATPTPTPTIFGWP